MHENGMKTAADWTWADIFRRHHAELFSYALHLCRSRHDAEDLVQNALLRIARRTRPAEDGLAYAMAAVRRLAIDRARSRHTRAAGGAIGVFDNTDADDHHTPNDATDLRRAFDSLDDAKREVIVLKVAGGLTLRQIAAVTDQPLGTVASSHRRALLEIRRTLERKAAEHERSAVPGT
jgi:RNA polymerase sigma factor (sigma-70 family)